MRDWLLGLELRERIIVIAGGGVAVLIVLWGAIWNPLMTGTTELTDSVVSKRAMLASLQRARSVAATTTLQVGGGAQQSLVLLVDQTHRSFGLEGALARNQPDGSDGIRVSFQNAPFDGLIAWLGALHTGYGVVVETATVDGGRAPGIVNANVVLRR